MDESLHEQGKVLFLILLFILLINNIEFINLKLDDVDFDDTGVDGGQRAAGGGKTKGKAGAAGVGAKAATKTEDKSSKGTELKALEVHAAKSNISKNAAAYFSMLSGNEETAQIYAFIFSNPSKLVYRELVKFRRRTAYFEYIVQLVQKALAEEMPVQEINEWCTDTLEWMQKRNASILGTQVAVIRKPEVITVAGNVQKPVAQEFVAEAERMFAATDRQQQHPQAKSKPKKKGGVKKYKLLIPLELELHEKIKVYF